MSAEEMRKDIEAMKEAFAVVVKQATEPLTESHNKKVEELFELIERRSNNIDYKVELLEEMNNDIQKMKDSLIELQRSNRSGAIKTVFDSLAAAFNTIYWKESDKKRRK